jgi:glycolate oxidase
MDVGVDTLAALLPPGVLTTDPGVMSGYRRDSADIVPAGQPAALVRATTVDDVAATLAWANAHAVAVVPRGAGTGLSGGANAIDGCIVLSLERMTVVRSVDPQERLAVVEAGVVTADVARAAAEHGLFYPPDPSSFELCTIGGNLATNAGGMRCLKYGVTRDATLGLEVVLADGRVLHTGGRTTKNTAGYDLTSLLVGSEGTLGVITAATLRLRPAPTVPPVTFVASFSSLSALGDAVHAIQASGVTPSLLELLDNVTINAVEDHTRLDLDRRAAGLLIGQADGAAGDADVDVMLRHCQRAGADLVVRAADALESDLLLHARRLAGTAVMAKGPTVIEDVGVPPAHLSRMLVEIQAISRRSGITIATTGHAGDGNLHPILLLPSLHADDVAAALAVAKEVCAVARSLGGTITGEHGVGVLKREWLAEQLDDVALDAHRAVKAALDPVGILNPGRAF